MRMTSSRSPDLLRGRGLRAPIGPVSLAIASRLLLGVILLLGASATHLLVFGHVPLSAEGQGIDHPFTAGGDADTIVHRSGSTTAELIDRLRAALSVEGVRLIELRLGRPVDTHVDVRLRIDLDAEEASEVARVVAALSSVELDEVRIRSVTPTVAGVRLDVGGTLDLSTDRLEVELQEVDRTAVGLTSAVERSGARLRRLEVPEVRDGSVVLLAVQGTLEALVVLLNDLERHHTAPIRFEAFRVEAIDGREFELAVGFRPRGSDYRDRRSERAAP